MNDTETKVNLSIAGDKSHKKNQIFLKLILVLFLLFFLGFAFYKLVYVRVKSEKKTESKEVSINVDENRSFTLPPIKQFNSQDLDENNQEGFIGDNKSDSESDSNSENKTRFVSKSTGTMIVKNSQVTTSNSTKENIIDENKIGTSSDMFSNTSFKPSLAQKNIYNPNLLLEQGTYIPCVLRQKLISNIGGQISCTISENVLSKNGNVVLIEKGSKAIGVYQTGAVSHGSDQIFVIWQEIRTANNIVVNVNSGSTDELGANGITGWTDQHFWKRFGNAILLSMILDTSSSLTTQLQKKRTENYLENTQQNTENLSQTILEQMGDIKPTLYKNQGDKVGIFVARDIDFSNVYTLTKKVNK